jgi:hypothetical protein
MYSKKHTRPGSGGFPDQTVRPEGELVSVALLREHGCKVTKDQLADAEWLHGRISYEQFGDEPCMAYRIRDSLRLMAPGALASRSLACLNNPVLRDWNVDGQIFEGWVLEPCDEGKMAQVVQVWWIKRSRA